jgi:hypothetical protein
VGWYGSRVALRLPGMTARECGQVKGALQLTMLV